jgi:hypothetical protein
MEKSKIIKILAMAFGFCFSNMYASWDGYLLDEGTKIVSYGVKSLQEEWSRSMVKSLLYFAAQCREKLKNSPSFEWNRQLEHMSAVLASLEKVVRDLDELAKEPNEGKKQFLKSIACRSDPCLRSLILSRLDQIEKGQNGAEKQAKEKEERMDGKDVPPAVSVKRRTNPRPVKSGNPEKRKKK